MVRAPVTIDLSRFVDADVVDVDDIHVAAFVGPTERGLAVGGTVIGGYVPLALLHVLACRCAGERDEEN